MKEEEIPIRLTVIDPPVGVMFAVQRGRSELHQATPSTGSTISFDFTVRARPTANPNALNLLGPYAQGPPTARFVYVNSGTYAGEPASCWSRRAKVPLSGITPELMRKLAGSPGARLEARIAGTGRDGGPACASVALLDQGWRIVVSDSS